jgi:type I restriction enzyme S subunit
VKAGYTPCSLGSVAKVIAGQSPEGKYYNDKDEGLPFYQGKKEFGERVIGEPTTWTTDVTKIGEPGDILMSVRAPVGPVNFTDQKICIGRGLAAIRSSETIDSDFLYYQLLSKQDEIAGTEGAVFASINKAAIEALQVVVPAIEEQRRIVTLLDEAVADIATAKANAEKNLQNARELFEGHLQSIFSNPGHGWQARTLEELGTITSSKRIFKDEYVEVGIPFYRTKEIKELANGLEITTELFITESRYNEIKSGFGVPKKGDILLTAIGTIGEIWVVDGKNDFYFKDGNVLWLKNFNSVNTQFLKYVLLSFVESLKKMSHGSAYSALPIQRLNAHQIFLPTREEQAQIVNALDELLDFSRQLEAIYRQKLTALDDLKKSLLHQAFSGQL